MSITISISASRTSGVAPLYVNFDASGTTSTTEDTASKAFRNLFFIWNFGDSGAGTWAYGNSVVNSKNTAYGGIGAHVFETPGSYTVTLSVYDGTEDAYETDTVDITVTDPDTVSELSGSNVIAVSTDGDFTGKPASATEVTTSDVSTAFGNLSSTKKKILFKCGQTWTDTGATIVSTAGRGIIGQWGSGADPILTSSSSAGTLLLTTSDWSVQDVCVRNSADSDSISNGSGNWSKILCLRVTADQWGANGILSNEYSGDAVHSEIAIVDCVLTNDGGGGGYCSYFASEKAAVMGTLMDGNASGVGQFRTQYFTKSVLSNNRFVDSPDSFHAIKYGAPKRSSGTIAQYVNLYSELSVVSDNDVDNRNCDANANNWIVAIGPENGAQDERVRDTVFERNWVRAGPNNVIGILVMAVNCVTRNNIVDMTDAHDGAAFHVDSPALSVYQRGVEPTPTGDEFYNNTVWRGDAVVDVSVEMVRFYNGTGHSAKNNIAYSPLNSGKVDAIVDADSNTASNNTSDAQFSGTNPGPSWSSPAVPADFQITSGSYGFAAGASVKVFDDYFGRSRIGVTNDMGFYQVTEGEYPWEGSQASLAGRIVIRRSSV